MTARHNRNFFFIANRAEVRGEVTRPATPSEQQRAFRFSEIVSAAPDTAASDALIEALAELMTSQAPDLDSHIPAGFTYLAQFVDHDMTRDRTSVPFGQSVDPTSLLQARSPELDLDSMYGRGPIEDPQFYESDSIRLKVGRTQESIPANSVAAISLDGFDLPRRGVSESNPEEVRMALIPDPRNDENLAVAQIHLAFIRFHNAVCRLLADQGVPSALIFERARESVVKHYQWMLRTDFLPRIVDPAIVDDVFLNGRKVFEVGATNAPTMPIEFSVACYRLGHSMIRDNYNWNAVFSPGGLVGDFGTLDNLFRFSATSGNLSPGTDVDNPLDGTFERLPTNWIADWPRLFDFVRDGFPELGPEVGLNMARPIDIRLTDPLKMLPLGSFAGRGTAPIPPLQRNLAFRNLVRGRMVGLASGQDVANHMGVDALQREQIIGDELSSFPVEIQNELANATPLWFYILREAGLNNGGIPGHGKLGAVGGRIVAETFHRAIEASTFSVIRDRSFRPSLGGSTGLFRMTDLLLIAYDASEGELRPLSPDAPRPGSTNAA